MGMTQGNTKLGALIWCFSIPAMKAICVGATELCASMCYAMKGFFRMPNVKESHQENYKLSLDKQFSAYLCAMVAQSFARVVRIHVSGDFYSVEYVRKWIKVAKRKPNVVFYGYTRSWRVPKFVAPLEELGSLPNVYLFYSCDAETGAPPRSRNIRRAYLMTNDDDVAPYHVDLNFRDNTKNVLKFDRKGRVVCPYDNGVTSTTCSTCKLCFTDCKMPKQKQLVSLAV